MGRGSQLNHVVLRWDATTDVVITIHVLPRDRVAAGDEWRLEQEIAAVIWATWHLAGVDAPAGE